MRRSHVAYLGGGQEAVVYRCESCGAESVGPSHDRGLADAGRAVSGRGGRHRARRALSEGDVENPVIDADMARLLRERFGGD